MTRATEVPSLPSDLKPLFWEYDFGRLSWEKDQGLIIGRILAHGDWQAAHWLVGVLGKDGIREWICRREGRGLDARCLRFWELVVGLPHRKVNAWLRQQAGLPWTTRAND